MEQTENSINFELSPESPLLSLSGLVTINGDFGDNSGTKRFIEDLPSPLTGFTGHISLNGIFKSSANYLDIYLDTIVSVNKLGVLVDTSAMHLPGERNVHSAVQDPTQNTSKTLYGMRVSNLRRSISPFSTCGYRLSLANAQVKFFVPLKSNERNIIEAVHVCALNAIEKQIAQTKKDNPSADELKIEHALAAAEECKVLLRENGISFVVT